MVSRRSRTAQLPTRSRRYGVGKEIGGAIYVHRNYEDVFGPPVGVAKQHLPRDFEYTIVKLTVASKMLSFIEVPNFDTAAEPSLGVVITVKQDGTVRATRPPADPYIYHHKWLFVSDDYGGFNVAESKRRSLTWMRLPVTDKSRIGRKHYWETHVAPLLDASSR